MNHALVIDGVLSATTANAVSVDRIGSCVRMLHASSGVFLEGNQLSMARMAFIGRRCRIRRARQSLY